MTPTVYKWIALYLGAAFAYQVFKASKSGNGGLAAQSLLLFPLEIVQGLSAPAKSGPSITFDKDGIRMDSGTRTENRKFTFPTDIRVDL